MRCGNCPDFFCRYRRTDGECCVANRVKGSLTWKDIFRICEVAAGMLGKNINEELMGRYESPQEFYEKVLEKI